jgi:hypothetical protein
MKSEMATPPSLDWAAWEAKLSDPSIVGKIKALAEKELEAGAAALEKETPFAELEKEVDAAFNGAGGLVRARNRGGKRARVPCHTSGNARMGGGRRDASHTSSVSILFHSSLSTTHSSPWRFVCLSAFSLRRRRRRRRQRRRGCSRSLRTWKSFSLTSTGSRT